MTSLRRILIVDDEEDFLVRAKRNIKKFEAVPASTVTEALQLISDGGISLIVADMKLRGRERGYEIFDALFRNGEAIPVILITGYELTDTDERHFKSLGAIEILVKAGEMGPLSKVIEQTATRILADENSRFSQVEKKIWQEDLQDKRMTHGGSTNAISAWLEIAKKPAISDDERKAILKGMASACDRYVQHRDSTDYAFPHF